MTEVDTTQQEQHGEETSTDSSSENNQGGGAPSSEVKPQADDFSNLPLDKHPRWQERERDWNKRFEDLNKNWEQKLAEAIKSAQPATPQNQSEDIPEWFGGDEKQWKAYKADQARIAKETEENAYKRFEKDSKEKEARVAEANKWFEDSVAEIESKNPGAKVNRNDLLAFVLEKQLIDPQGRWNYALGYEVMTALQNAAKGSPNRGLDDRRRLADTTVQDGGRGGAGDDKGVASSDTFRSPANRPW